jgi:Zn-dependent protease
MFRSGFKLGKIFGIDVYVDWSWLLIFLLITYQLATVFNSPQVHPDWSPALAWGTAIVAALLFFGSVLAHELAHSIVAKSRGLPVNRITLFLFGGVSNIEREPTSPSTEFLMAIVGPLTSFVLGILFLALGGAIVFANGRLIASPLGFLRGLDPVATLLLWLGPINIVLAIFNMIPGFPLDGGRVLRSIFWAITGSLKRATRWASWIGQGVAWLMILAGISMVFGANLPFLGTGTVPGLWLAFIGWFLNNAAVQSYRQVVLEDLLGGVQVSTLMRPNAATVPPNISLNDLVYDHIMNSDERAFPVLDGDRLVGMVSLGDVRQIPRSEWDVTPVSKVMTPADHLAIATPHEEVTQAMNDIASHDVRQVPVVQDGRYLGVLRREDIMKWLQLHTDMALRGAE